MQGSTRLDVAFRYARLEQFAKATEQYDLWITSHPDDVRLPAALNGRCSARAFGDVELQSALADCNAALRHAAKGSPFYAEVTRARGFVFLRMGDYDKSIADFDASLKVAPKDASVLYCRGIDKLRKQKTSEGQADIAQATAISSEVAANLSRHGIFP
jgi:tetratricopeptide (TPR) repeat protein